MNQNFIPIIPTEEDYKLAVPGIEDPQSNGKATAGISDRWAREDHIHPSESAALQVLMPDVAKGKEKISGAINDKGGSTTMLDSYDDLAAAIRKLVPAQISFQTSGSVNPAWHDLNRVMAEHYDADMPYMMGILFPKDLMPSVNLNGGAKYLCYDGYSTASTETHTFLPVDTGKKTTGWIIVYGEDPAFYFNPEIWTRRIYGLSFYNANMKGIFADSLAVSNIQIDTNKESIITQPYAFRGALVNSLYFHEGIKSIEVETYSFEKSIQLLEVQFPESLETLIIKDCAFSNCTRLEKIHIPSNLKHLQLGPLAFYNTLITTFKTPPTLESFTMITSPFSTATKLQRFEIPDSPELVFKQIGNYPFTASGIKEIVIGKCKSIAMANMFGTFSNIVSVSIESPELSFALASTAGTPNVYIFRLGDGWNYAINLSPMSNQTVESMVQNCEALADRTGMTALVLTYGAAKLAKLQEEAPEAITLAQSKNWTLK